MKKFNAIKILQEELENKKIFDKNISKEKYMKSVYKFVDVFVEPILKRKIKELNLQAPRELIEKITKDILNDINISKENKNNMLKIETINLYYNDIILNQLKTKATYIINELGLIDKDSYLKRKNIEDDISNFLNEEEIGFLSKDKKIKEKVANKLATALTT